MKRIIFIVIAVFILWSGYQTHQHPQLKFNSLADRMSSPLDTRLHYRIAEVDSRFKLSIEQVKVITQQATQIWKDGTGQDYFVYDPNAKLAIHLIYDERQFESEQRREHLNQLESNQQVWLDKKEPPGNHRCLRTLDSHGGCRCRCLRDILTYRPWRRVCSRG